MTKQRKHALGDHDSVPAKHKFVPEVMLPPHIDRYHKKAEQGDAEAQYNLGMPRCHGQDCGNEKKKKRVQHTASSLKEMPPLMPVKSTGPKRELTLEEEEEEQEEQEKFHRFLSFFSELDDRERDVLRLRFGLDGRRPKTLAEVGMMYHRSGERIRQIQNVALAKLRAMIEDEKESASEAEESD